MIARNWPERIAPAGVIALACLCLVACRDDDSPEAQPETAGEPAAQFGPDESPAARDPDAPDVVHYQCGDVLVSADFGGQDAVGVTLPWRDVTLPQAVAASGARYADGEIELWTRGQDRGRLTTPVTGELDCIASEQPSPWHEARRRGLAFRAVGNEPGWRLELTGGADPEMHLELDYGEHALEFDRVEVFDDGARYVAESPGNRAEVRLYPETCTDPMVGWPFPVRVDMELNDLELTACGRFLDDRG